MSKKKKIIIEIEDGELARDNLADLLCWWNGFRTGIRLNSLDDFHDHKIAEDGIEMTRDLIIKIKDAINLLDEKPY